MKDADLLDDLPAARSLTSLDEPSSGDEALTVVVAPPDSFLGDDSSTPTPMLDSELLDSGNSTPRLLESPSTDSLTGKTSPLVVAQHRPYEDQVSRTSQGSPDNSRDQQADLDSRQPLSPLAKASYSVSYQTTEHAATVPASHAKGLSIFPSSQHDCQPTEHHDNQEDIASYSLSRKSTSTSLESEVGQATAPSSKESDDVYEGTNL